MIAHLAKIVTEFPGTANQTRCFDHITNLVAHSILRPFDVPKANADAILDQAEKELQELAAELEEEVDNSTDPAPDSELDDELSGEDDDIDGWVDERESLSQVDKVALDESVRPVKKVLLKVPF